jgi:hypothetical protein
MKIKNIYLISEHIGQKVYNINIIYFSKVLIHISYNYILYNILQLLK